MLDYSLQIHGHHTFVIRNSIARALQHPYPYILTVPMPSFFIASSPKLRQSRRHKLVIPYTIRRLPSHRRDGPLLVVLGLGISHCRTAGLAEGRERDRVLGRPWGFACRASEKWGDGVVQGGHLGVVVAVGVWGEFRCSCGC